MYMHDILLAMQYLCMIGLFLEILIILRGLTSPLHTYLLLNCIATLVNNVGYLFELKSSTEEAYITALQFSYLGRIWLAFFMLLFVGELTRIRIPVPLRNLMAAIHLAIYAVILTLRSHTLYYSDYTFTPGGIFPRFSHTNGLVHHFNMTLQIVYASIGLTMLFLAQHKEKTPLAKRRLRLVMSATLVEITFFLIQIHGIPGLMDIYDVTMQGYFLGTVIMLIAIFSSNLLGVREIAKEFVIDNFSEGIIAVDTSGKVQYYNEPAARLFPILRQARNAWGQAGLSARSESDNLLTMLTETIADGQVLKLDGRLYQPQVNDLLHEGESHGTLFVLSDETEHLRYLKELEEQREIADRANEAKSRFLANMSHEIRTPINAILGLDEMILRESAEPDIRSYATDILSAGGTLLSLINDILDLSKVEEGKMEIIPVEYDLSSLINDLCNMIRDRAAEKGLTFFPIVNEEIPHALFGDEIRIRQCVLNILTNAVKYTQKGSVTLSVTFERKDDDHILLAFLVKDTGIGMKQEDLDKLFAPFQRIEEKRNRSIEGTGLGMSITKQLLELMGSQLHVESEYGKGTVMSFALEQKILSWDAIGNYASKLDERRREKSTYEELFHAPDARILVVDDTRINLVVLQGLLKKTLIQIDTALSGKEAIALANENTYDVLFIDHMMPEMDGIETLQQLRRSGKNTGTPAVALTANAVAGAKEMYLAKGFTAYLSKPVDGSKLEQMLKQLLPVEKQQEFQNTGTSDGNSSGNEGISGTGSPDSDPDEIFTFEPEPDIDFLPGWIYHVNDLDVNSGVLHCGTQRDFLSVLSTFHGIAASNAAEIERLCREEDIKKYTIKVHALKSSAEIIGAHALSKAARKLEEAGRRQDIETIRSDTANLLAMYHDLDRSLSPLDEDESSNK